jgi:hypothetical protein
MKRLSILLITFSLASAAWGALSKGEEVLFRATVVRGDLDSRFEISRIMGGYGLSLVNSYGARRSSKLTARSLAYLRQYVEQAGWKAERVESSCPRDHVVFSWTGAKKNRGEITLCLNSGRPDSDRARHILNLLAAAL